MIVNFYKKVGVEWHRNHSYKLIASKNIGCIPQKGTFITLSGQLFTIDRVCFDIDKCEYNLYIVRTANL